MIRAGLQTTVQDLGRWGFQARGVPVSGAMDPFAHRVANALVGNRPSAATLEVTLAGPELSFDDDRTVAVAGATFDLAVDDVAVGVGEPVAVRRGSIIRFGERRYGSRAYVAIAGGIDVPPVLGSRSTHMPSRMGGLHGRTLVAGDVLPLGPVSRAPRRSAGGSIGLVITRSSEPARVRVIPGPQLDRFAPAAIEILQSAPYRVLANSDRMGFRLAGPALPHTSGADIISEPAPIGALQVPADGQPILLMADRQTAGGYAKLATVITADLGIAAQLAPGDELSFAVCTQAEALAALIATERPLLALEAQL